MCAILLFLQGGDKVGSKLCEISNDKVTKVFRGNYKGNQAEFFKKRKCSEGFHRQEISLDNFYDVVRYIYRHDKNMYKSKKKCRMEILFEKIEKESAKNI